MLAASRQHHPELVVGDVARARRLVLVVDDAVKQLAPRQQGDDLEVGRREHPHPCGDLLVYLVTDDDALLAHHRHSGMFVEPVAGVSRYVGPAPQLRSDVPDVQERLEHPEAVDVDGDVGASALLVHQYLVGRSARKPQDAAAHRQMVCCRA